MTCHTSRKRSKCSILASGASPVFLATQGLGFRGHDETKDSHNRGNFVKLLENFQHYSGNKQLAECLFEEDRLVFSGLSSSIQNDLIECLYDEVIE